MDGESSVSKHGCGRTTLGDEFREKKKQYHTLLIEKTDDSWQRYQIAKKEAKKVVAFEKAALYADLNKKLESHDSERYVYQLGKIRNRHTEDIEKFFGMNDENGHLLTEIGINEESAHS
uniref:Uncharacterized protein n=1 Tax=Haemonchus contortus TaxID=6289 RepID=W6NBA9_HAECO